MNNEVKAWVETTTDADALRVLRHAIDQRLADILNAGMGGGQANAMEGGGGGGGGGGGVNPGAPQAMAPLRRTEDGAAGILAAPMTGPNPAPFYADRMRESVNAEVIRAAEENARQAGMAQRGRAKQLAQQGPEPSEDEQRAHDEQNAREAKEQLMASGEYEETGEEEAEAPKPKAAARGKK